MAEEKITEELLQAAKESGVTRASLEQFSDEDLIVLIRG